MKVSMANVNFSLLPNPLHKSIKLIYFQNKFLKDRVKVHLEIS
jgi:hypothetical protein